MPSFAVSIAMLGLVQAALVALPRSPLPPLADRRLRSRWWALVPAISIVVVIVAVNFYEGSATFLTYLALVAVPPLAALALGLLVRGARPALARGRGAALRARLGPAGGARRRGRGDRALRARLRRPRLDAGLGRAARWLRLGVYAMAAIDAWLVAGDLLQGPNAVLSAAAPAADLPRLQVVHFGSARMGFGDLFVAALVGCLLVSPPTSTAAGGGPGCGPGAGLRPALLRRRHAAGDGAGGGGAGPRAALGESIRRAGDAVAAAAVSSAVGVPLLQVRKRVDRAAALIPAGRGPDLEVEVAGGGVAGVADDADRLAGADRFPAFSGEGSARCM